MNTNGLGSGDVFTSWLMLGGMDRWMDGEMDRWVDGWTRRRGGSIEKGLGMDISMDVEEVVGMGARKSWIEDKC